MPRIVVADTLKTFIANFHREYTKKGEKENLEGEVFYDFVLKKLYILLQMPVKQWMILQGFETIIYYPDEKQAFRLKSKIDAVMPFFQAFIGCMQEDFGLSSLGYSLANYVRKGHVLTSNWNPPPRFAKLLGKAILVYDSRRLIRVEYRNPSGHIMREGTFGQHIQYGGYFFPLEISIISKSPAEPELEKILYLNPILNAPFPKKIKEFNIPASVTVKEIEWQ